MKLTRFILLFIAFLAFKHSFSQVLMGASGSFNQDFNGLASTLTTNTWSDNSTLQNTFSQRTTTSVLYAANNGSSSSGGMYSYGATGSNERALGTIGSSNTNYGGSFAHGVLLKNNSGFTINSIKVSYVLEQWRNGGNTTPNTMTFWYQVSQNTISSLTPGSNSVWNPETTLDATSPINTATAGALDGNNSLNQIQKSSVLIPNLSIPNGHYVMLRWLDIDHPGTDHGLAIDNVIIEWALCVNTTTFYQDNDNDGFGNPNLTTQSCQLPVGYVTNGNDCNDNNSQITVATTYYTDADGDGFGTGIGQSLCQNPGSGYAIQIGDCNDSDNQVYPGAVEICDGLDNDCDGIIDNGLTFTTYYPDNDGDGYGIGNGQSLCKNPGNGYVTISGDCNDSDAQIRPGAIEICDDKDNDCNGIVDDGLIFVIYYSDNDNDGFGGGNGISSCQNLGAGYVIIGGDCNDTDNQINPLAIEVCDGVDNDCDGLVDDSLTFVTYYVDNDNDGFGGGTGQSLCKTPGQGYITIGGDCDDTDKLINPSATEICDGLDNDCDGLVDDSLNNVLYFVDSDKDGFGIGIGQFYCQNPGIGFSLNNDDCDDNNDLINPTAVEICDGIDNNCDGSVDEGLNGQIYYVDNDNDGYGIGNGQTFCQDPGTGYSLLQGDCDDSDKWVNPNEVEVCDGIDNDCDGSIDEGLNGQIYYVDADNDGYGSGNGQSFCQNPGNGYVLVGGDCNDNNNQINPAANEICDGIDNNCDGSVDEGLTGQIYYTDNDNDGYGAGNGQDFCQNPGNGFSLVNGDCNDNNNLINPAANEICDGMDNDCDGYVDEGLTGQVYYTDNDNDGYGAGNGQDFCQNPGNGFSLVDGDCNDTNAGINPSAYDIPGNSVDENCDGFDAPIAPVMLGIYEFTQAAACPVTATSVTTQPSNATFGNFSSNNVTCSSAANVISNKDWNTSQTIDLNEYNEFSISSDNCNFLKLSKLAFNHRCSASGGTPNWIVRSSLDNFTSNVGTGTSGNNNNVNLSDTIQLNASFDSLKSVTFRIYLTGIGNLGATWRMDNVSLYGNVFQIVKVKYFADKDGDGFGDINSDTLLCEVLSNYVKDSSDCNDLDSLINPNTVWYNDSDNDLIGDIANTFVGCISPLGFVFLPGDCDDNNNQINSNANEICDGIDNNCDGSVDEGLSTQTYFPDSDNDGFGTGNGQSYCQDPGSGFVLVAGDCDDTDASINPGANDLSANGIDEDCDGIDGALGLYELTNVKLSIHPNPSSGIFHLNFNQKIILAEIKLMDLNGKLIKTTIFSGNSIEMNESNLEKGCYFIQVISNGVSIIERVIVD